MNRARAQIVGEVEATRIGRCIQTIQHITGNHVLMVLLQEPNGEVYAHCAPGMEKEILQIAAGLDWKATRRVAEEFFLR